MQFLQLYYTSCRRGLLPGSGFQTYSMSEGISDEERKEIERLSLYIPPLDLPSQPTPGEIKTLFPVSFTFFRLKSGRYGICQSKYTGLEYGSIRFGNYFSHALVLEHGDWNFYPIEFYRSSVFKDCLNEVEANIEQQPAPLPVLKQVYPDGLITFDSVTNFLQDEDRTSILEDILNALMIQQQSKRRLVLCDHQDNIPFWIGAVQMAYPLKLAQNISFTTYTFDPESVDLNISATPRTGTHFAFSDTQRNFKYYIIDLLKNEKSQVETKSRFAQMVNIAYSFSRESLDDFQEFSVGFDCSRMGFNIEGLFLLYTLIRSGISSISNDDIRTAINFALAYADSGTMKKLVDRMSDKNDFGEIPLDIASSTVDLDTSQVIAQFLFQVAVRSNQQRYNDLAFTFVFNSLHHLLVDYGCTVSGIQPYLATFSQVHPAFGRQLTERLISPENIRDLSIYLKGDPMPEHHEFYLTLIINSLIASGLGWKQFAAHFEAVPFCLERFRVLSTAGSKLEPIFECAAQDSDLLAHLLVNAFLYCDRSQNLVRQFMNVMNHTEQTVINRIHSLVGQIEGGYDFLWMEFLLSLSHTSDKRRSFWQYYEASFAQNPGFRKQYYSEAIIYYLQECLAPSELYPECLKLLQQEIKRKQINNPETLKVLIKGFEQGLPLSSPNNEIGTLIVSLEQLKENTGINTAPDITRMMYLALVTNENSSLRVDLNQLFKNQESLDYPRAITRNRYMDYLTWSLSAFLKNVKGPLDHEALLKYLSLSGCEEDLFEQYYSTLENLLNKEKEGGLTSFTCFILYYLNDLVNYSSYNPQRIDKLHLWIVSTLSHQPKARKEKLDNELRALLLKHKKITKTKEIRNSWYSLLDEAEEVFNNSLKGKTLNLFKNIIRKEK